MRWYRSLKLVLGAAGLTAALASCSDPDPTKGLPYPEFGANQSVFTDRELLQAVYTGYRYPPSFSREELDGYPSYVNSFSLQDSRDREFPPEPLCTDIADTARVWSDIADRNGSTPRRPVGERETEKYFEFRRVGADSSRVFLSRVSKCSYFEADHVPVLTAGRTIGTLNVDPLMPRSLSELAEYLWFIEHHNWSGFAVLSSHLESEGEGASVEARHVIFDVRTVYGDWGAPDSVTLRRLTFTLLLSNGEVRYDAEELRTIDGRYNPNPFGVSSNIGLQPTSPVVTPLGASGVPRPSARARG